MDFFEIVEDVHSYLQNIENINIDIGWGNGPDVPDKYGFEWEQAMWHCVKAKDYIDKICYSIDNDEE